MSSTPAWHVFKKLDLAGLTCAEKGTIRTASRADCGGLRMYASDSKIQRAGVRSRARICEGGAANRHKVGVRDKAKDARFIASVLPPYLFRARPSANGKDWGEPLIENPPQRI